MTNKEQILFWDIIDYGMGSSGLPFYTSQTGAINPTLPIPGGYQIPEPWNGNLSTAKIVFVGANPGYDAKELCPTTGDNLWQGSGRYGFNKAKVEDYFENRFNNNPFVFQSPRSFAVLMRNGRHKSIRYWRYVYEIANDLLSNVQLGDCALAEVIQLKSRRAEMKLLYPVLPQSYLFLQQILNLSSNKEYVVAVGGLAGRAIFDFYRVQCGSNFEPFIDYKHYCQCCMANRLYGLFDVKDSNGNNIQVLFVYHNAARGLRGTIGYYKTSRSNITNLPGYLKQYMH